MHCLKRPVGFGDRPVRRGLRRQSSPPIFRTFKFKRSASGEIVKQFVEQKNEVGHEIFLGKLGAVKNKEKSRHEIECQDANLRVLRTLRAGTVFHRVQVAKVFGRY